MLKPTLNYTEEAIKRYKARIYLAEATIKDEGYLKYKVAYYERAIRELKKEL